MFYMAKDQVVRVRIDSELLAKLEKQAVKLDRTVSWLIRKAIEDSLKK